MSTPRTWFGVIGANEPKPQMCVSREHAEALAIVHGNDWSRLGPFTVVELVEVQTIEPAVQALAA